MSRDNFWFERMVRRECSECGKSEGLAFMTLRQLKLTLPDRADRLAEVSEILPDGSHSWACTLCRGFGVFGPLEYEAG